MYKRNSTDAAMVKQIQRALYITADGSFGPGTEAAVMKFQREHSLVADGIVGRKTLEEMGILDTDLKVVNTYRTEEGLVINKRHLPTGEYIEESYGKIQNDYIFFHHTSGWNNPFAVVDDWGRDTRGRICTEFVIGGQNVKNGDDTHDGLVVQAFPEGCQGWHLGVSGGKDSHYMNRHSVGIELCGFGYLTEGGKTYVGGKAKESQIVTLEEAFRGHKKWHRYSDDQLKSLQQLLLHISDRDNIDLDVGIINWIRNKSVSEAFGFQQEAFDGAVKGLLTHTNVRKDKTDCCPQQELIDMLLSI
jgi:hypothetical protein